MCQFAILFIIASRVWKYGLYFYHKRKSLLNHENLTMLSSIHNLFHFLIGSIFILYLHDISCIIMILLMLINYTIAKFLYKTKYFVIITWLYNITAAFIGFKYEGCYPQKFLICCLKPNSFLFYKVYHCLITYLSIRQQIGISHTVLGY